MGDFQAAGVLSTIKVAVIFRQLSKHIRQIRQYSVKAFPLITPSGMRNLLIVMDSSRIHSLNKTIESRRRSEAVLVCSSQSGNSVAVYCVHRLQHTARDWPKSGMSMAGESEGNSLSGPSLKTAWQGCCLFLRVGYDSLVDLQFLTLKEVNEQWIFN